MSYVTEVATHSPRHEWRCHDSSVSSILDTGSVSDMDFRAEIGTVVTRNAGPLGGGQTSFAFGFNGSSAIVLDSILASIANKGTVVWWAKKASTGSGGGRCFCSTAGTPQQVVVEFIIRDASDILYHIRVNGGSNNELKLLETTPVDSTDWHMYSVVADNVTYAKLYKDGVLVSHTVDTQTGTCPDDAWYGDADNSYFFPAIGARVTTSATPLVDGYFTGDIAEIFIVDNELSAANILALWDAADVGGDAPLAKHQRRRGRRLFNAAAL